MNCGIINSVTKLHLVGYCYWVINRSVITKSGLIVTRLELFITSARWQRNSQWTGHAVTAKDMTETIYLDATDLALLILSSMNDTRTTTNCPQWALILWGIESHSNPLLQPLPRGDSIRRLKRRWPADLYVIRWTRSPRWRGPHHASKSTR